ncbi:YcgN family cysteine cluster protein [Stappia sp. MMSF_3263]|uniref:YcgN family cysteine cluster protein n=1 Tax=Stappia sp. MMSF_3263 TaxID=3046693 RepID=UPI00273FEE8E|nr:YcgN family cysteine cluster protein [Stappia sp. MMSF_3263]
MDPEMIDKAAGGAHEDAEAPFWKRKGLNGLTDGEWESLCDGCGRCCLNKLEDWDTGEIAWTSLACTLFDAGTCRCGDYENRLEKVPDCLPLTPETVPDLTWLPPTCGYRLVGEGRDLYWWHPLVSGDPDTVHAAGISARGKTFPEDGVPLEDYENFLVDWPGENPMEEKARMGFIE